MHADGANLVHIFGGDYYATRAALNGSGLPPYNSSMKPAPNLVVIDACSVFGGSNNFENALYPGTNFYSNPNVENQVVWGYKFCIVTDQSIERATLLMQNLIAGHTILASKVLFLLDAEEVGVLTSENAQSPYDWRPMNQYDDVQIVGDIKMQLKNVYDGSVANPTWHRPIQ